MNRHSCNGFVVSFNSSTICNWSNCRTCLLIWMMHRWRMWWCGFWWVHVHRQQRTNKQTVWNLNCTTTWTSQDSHFSKYLLQPIKRYCENVKPRGSEQYIPINLRSLPIVNDQTQSNTLSSKPMIIHQPQNTPDNCGKHVQVAYVHGKLNISFLRNHIYCFRQAEIKLGQISRISDRNLIISWKSDLSLPSHKYMRCQKSSNINGWSVSIIVSDWQVKFALNHTR